MRKLKSDEIECRVAQVSDIGCSLLLYKTARVDRAILDEMYTACGWQNDFKVIDGKMYGGIGVRIQDDNGHFEWVWKWDCGTESNTEAEKGQASDCFKRAGFKWGIGVELYSAPFIFVKTETKKNEKGKYELVNKYQKFKVLEIGYADNGDINKLKIVDDKKQVVYEMGKFIKQPIEQNDTKEHIENIKSCSSRSELLTYWDSLEPKDKKNIEIVKAFKEMGKKYPDENKGEVKAK